MTVQQPEPNRIYQGDTLQVLKTWPDSFVQCVVTSPPYWNLRNYNVPGQLGLEKTPEEYVSKMVEVFREVRRVIRGDGTLWLNLGDSYTSGRRIDHGSKIGYKQSTNRGSSGRFDPVRRENPSGLKAKDLCGVPWRVAFALQADGWYLRSDIIWSKPNPMPESVEDRPTRSHEYLFLLSKSPRYFFDMEAIREPASLATIKRLEQPTFDSQTVGPKDSKEGNRLCRKALENLKQSSQAKLVEYRDKQRGHSRRHAGFNGRWDLMSKEEQCVFMRNKRSVWEIATEPFRGAHFATFPQKLVEHCILAGTSEKGCCKECGAPRKRIVKKIFIPQSDVSLERGIKGACGQKPMDDSNSWNGYPRGTITTETLDWEQTCKHEKKEIMAKGIVLDPFIGSGTTALVALRFNRKFLGIELKPEYVEMANERIAFEMAQGKMF